MKKFIAIILLTTCCFLTAQAQAVGHGADIDAQIAGKPSAKTSPKTSTTKPTRKPEESHAAPKPTEPATTTEHRSSGWKMVLRRIKVKKKPNSNENRTRVTKGSHHEDGFRVQVYTGGNTRVARQEAERAGQKVKAAMPNQPVYVHFYSPRWCCRVGNFKDYNSAKRILAQVRKLGYKEASIIRSKITVVDVGYLDE